MIERFKAIKHIILLYYIGVAMTLVFFYFMIPMDLSMDERIKTILIIYVIVFPVVMLFTMRYALHVFLFMLALISGFYGFYHHAVDDHSISNALYFTFRLYLLDFADVFTQDGSSPIKYPLLLEIARWTAASYTISTIFIAMYRTLEKEISLFMAQSFGGHHIIFSYNEKSHALIKDLSARKERVIVIDEKFTPETQNMLEDMKVVVITAAIDELDVFKLCGAKRAATISLFHEKDQESLYVLMHLEKFTQQKNIFLSLSKVIVHIEESRYKKELMAFLKRVEHFSFPVDLINVYEEIAKIFWRKHKEIFEGPAAIHLLVLGYGSFGKQIVEQAQQRYLDMETNQFITMTVLDDFKIRRIVDNREEIPFQIEEDSLIALMGREAKPFTHVFICLDEDYMDLMAGIELSEQYPTIPIYMKFKDESIEQTLLISRAENKQLLYSTGIIQDVLTKEYLGL